ncbi:HEAT repeat domain-containing protein [Maribacter sp. 2308TA10-17]|uniref:HEAT repeat domain-containing protein n=1 Tax=Maribacter sp. 2308TA10-17 TaxID=3386276 RepID=UPI0039BD508C
MITAPKIHTDLLWDLSFLFIGLAIVYFIFVFFYRNLLSKRSWQVKERKRELSPMISEFLFYEEDASKDEKSNYVNLKIEIRQLLKDDFNRKVLSEVLHDLRKDVSGETQKRLFKLYQDLGLHNDNFKKLKSWRWEVVSKAILNLTQMQVAEAYSFVTKFINDKRVTIRKQAEIAIVTLKPEGINYFLDTTKYKISEWQQLKLMDVLRNVEDYQPPQFKAWLTSTNRHVVLFALRLIKFYNQNDADSALIELVKHKNSQIKEEAIACIKEFRIEEALPTLKLVFWKSSIDVKISILGAIGTLGNDSDIEFLQLIEKKEANFSVRSKAHSSINAIAPGSIMPSKGVVNSAKYTIPEDIKIEVEEEEEFDEFNIEPIAEIELSTHSIEQIQEICAPQEEEAEEVTNTELNLPNETTDPKEDIIDNEVKTDVMKENQESLNQENIEPISEESLPKENETLSFDFLPFVVEEVLETEIISTEEDAKTDLNDMVVHFEEVIIQKGKPSLEITAEEIAFLPIVTEMIEESYVVEAIKDQSEHIALVSQIEITFEEVSSTQKDLTVSPQLDYSEYSTAKILDTTVVFEEILESENEYQIDPYFLSVSPDSPQEDTMDSKSNVDHEPLQSYDKMESQEEQNFKKIIKDLIGFNANEPSNKTDEEANNWPLLEFGDEFVDTSNTAEVDSEETTEKQEADTEDEVMEVPAKVELTIPKAILSDEIFDEIIEYKEDTEESRMQLLDDLAEMGDERELPLLNELLVNEKYTTVKDRVKILIKRFSEQEEKPEPDTLLKPFNVFEDLFRTCDTEAKLILMDEIVAVGDESDIDFLEGLLEHEEKQISNKAAQVLEELRIVLSIAPEKSITEASSIGFEQTATSKTETLKEEETLAEYDSLMEELQIQPPQTPEIFELTFELTEPLKKAKESNSKEKSGNSESFLGQICAFSNKIIDKLNG